MKLPVYGAIVGAIIFMMIRSSGFLSYLASNPSTLNGNALFGFAGYFTDFLFTAVLFGGFLHWGKQILRQFKLPIEPMKTEGNLFAVALGEAATAFLVLLLGFLGFYKSPLLPAVYCAMIYGAYRERRDLEAILRRLWSWCAGKVSIPEFFCVFIIGAAVFRAIVLNTAPPTDWDSLAYHLAFPKIYLDKGSFFRLSWSMNGHFPLNSEMIYLLALNFKRELACHWINFFHGIFVLLLIAAMSRRIFREPQLRLAGLLAAAIYAAQPVFSRVIGNAATDLNVTLISLLAIDAFLILRSSGESEIEGRWGFLCGVLTGAAMSAKLTGTWLALTIFVSLLVLSLKKPPRDWKVIGLYLIGIACAGLPWYLKNWVWTGNPVWPYLSELFGTTEIGLESWKRMKMSITEGVPKSIFNFLMIPALLVLKGDLFHYASQYLTLPFLLIPLHSSVRKSLGRMEKLALGIIVTFLVIWFWIYQDWRYFMPASAVMSALVAGWLVKILIAPTGRGAKHFVIAAAICFWPIKEMTVNNELFVFFNLKSKLNPEMSAKDRYLFGSLGPVYAVTQFTNATLPKNSKVLFFRDVRGYYLDRDYVWGDPLNPCVFSYAQIKNPEELHRKLRESGFTHILFNPFIGNYKGDQIYYAAVENLMHQTLKKYAVIKAELGRVALYEIRAI